MTLSLRPGFAPRKAGYFPRRLHGDLLAAAAHDPFVLPAAQGPAYRVKRGSGHLRDVLARDRKVDLDAVVGLAAGLIDQPQHRAGDPLLDLLGRHLDHPRLGLLQTRSDGLVGVRPEPRKTGLQRLPGTVRPGENDTVDRGDRACRIGRAPHRDGNTEEFALVDVARDDLVAGGRRPDDPHVAGEKQEELVRFLVLGEDLRVLRKARRTRHRQDRVEIGSAEAGEGGKSGDQGPVEGHAAVSRKTRLSWFLPLVCPGANCRRARHGPEVAPDAAQEREAHEGPGEFDRITASSRDQCAWPAMTERKAGP